MAQRMIFSVFFFFQMPRIDDRGYLIDLLNQCYCEQGYNCLFCFEVNCKYCKKSVIAEEEFRKNKFNSTNSGVVLWKITCYRNDPSILTIIPVN